MKSGEPTLDLVHRAQKGERDALNELLERLLPRLRRMARGQLPRFARDGADTEDLVQRVVSRTVNHLARLDVGAGLNAYLREGIKNEIRDELRRFHRRPERVGLSEDLVARGPSPLEAAIGGQAIATYEAALSQLDPSEREAVIGKVELGYSFQELADLLDKPTTDAARMFTRRAILKLADLMAAESSGTNPVARLL